EEVTGQGVLGLQASVTAAGARGFLMSLWPVPDEATRRLMEAFYTNLWAKGLPPAEALTRAEKRVRDDPSGKFKNPRDWAAWVFVGE
ncbi:MAG: CHAT domain-containing protein, partial [Deltaproteobacteria bacterium]